MPGINQSMNEEDLQSQILAERELQQVRSSDIQDFKKSGFGFESGHFSYWLLVAKPRFQLFIYVKKNTSLYRIVYYPY